MNRRRTVFMMMAAALALPVAAQTVDEILAKNIESRGGLKALQAVRAMRASGTIELRPLGMTGTLTVTTERPNRRLAKTEVMGMEILQAYDGQEVWSMRPPMAGGSGKPETMSPADLKLFTADADIDGYWVDYRKKGHKVELVGKEEMDGKPVYRLKASLKGGLIIDAYLDAETGLDLKYRFRTFVPEMNREADLEVRFSNYREADGVLINHTIEHVVDGTSIYLINVQKVEMNPEIPNGFFSKPQAVPTASPGSAQ